VDRGRLGHRRAARSADAPARRSRSRRPLRRRRAHLRGLPRVPSLRHRMACQLRPRRRSRAEGRLPPFELRLEGRRLASRRRRRSAASLAARGPFRARPHRRRGGAVHHARASSRLASTHRVRRRGLDRHAAALRAFRPRASRTLSNEAGLSPPEARRERRATMNRPNRTVRPVFVDHPILHPFVEELRESDRLRAFTEAFPAAARVSEPALPLLLAALHEQLDRSLVVLVPEDADARDLAEAVAWFVGDERVALLPSRGVQWGSGLDPAPHLVGERARALDILAAGGLVCASAAALAEPLPPAGLRPEPIRIAPGEEVSLEQLSESLALAGYDRVERADERGQFAVRGGLVDVFPTTGREPLRVEFWGDEIEQMRAFSPFTQRARHPVEVAVVYPAAERRLDLVDPGEAEPKLVPVLPAGPDLVWESDEVRAVWEEEGLEPVSLKRAARLDRLPAGQQFAFEAQKPALVA